MYILRYLCIQRGKNGRKKSFATWKNLFCYVILVSTRSETDREMQRFLLCSAETCNEIGNRMINSEAA